MIKSQKTGLKRRIKKRPVLVQVDLLLVKVKYLLCDQVKKERWIEQQVVAWFITLDEHLIITQHSWTVGLEYDNANFRLQKLYDHPGYPYRCFLRDPIFLQDKYVYTNNMNSSETSGRKLSSKNKSTIWRRLKRSPHKLKKFNEGEGCLSYTLHIWQIFKFDASIW